MKLELYKQVKLTRDYINHIDFSSNSPDNFYKGMIGTIVDIYYDENFALVEFDAKKYNLDFGVLSIKLNDLEPIK